MIHVEDNKVLVKGTIGDVLFETMLLMSDAVQACVNQEKRQRNLSDKEAEKVADGWLEFLSEQARERIRRDDGAAVMHIYKEDGSELGEKEDVECEEEKINGVPEL